MWEKMPNFAKYRDYSKSKKEILDILFLTRIHTEIYLQNMVLENTSL